jgi:hypothetical protein
MESRLARTLALSLGLIVGSAQADETEWRTATERPTKAVQAAQAETATPRVVVGRPTGLAAPEHPTPAAALGRPVPLNEAAGSADNGPAFADRKVRQFSYSSLFAADNSPPLAQSKPEDDGPQVSTDTSDLGPLPITPLDSETEPKAERIPKPNPVPVPFHKEFGPTPVPFSEGEPGFGEPGTGLGGPGDGDYCQDGNCAWQEQPGHSPWLWFFAEYLNWGIKDSHLPPLVTTGGAMGMGILGMPDTATLLGSGSQLNKGSFNGGRFGMGLWFNDCHTIGLDGSIMFLDQHRDSFSAGSLGTAFLGVPFIDAGFRGTGAISPPFPNIDLVAAPTGVMGRVSVSQATRLGGADANVRWHLCDGSLCCGCCYQVDLLGGFRYAELRDSLTISEMIMVPVGTVTPTGRTSGTFQIMDQFKTNNQFYGGQIGSEAEFRYARWFLGLTGKVAIGNMLQTVAINGVTTISNPPLMTTAAGGLLAQPSNSGVFSRDRFAVVPEFGLKIGYQVSDNIRIYAGYDLLVMSSVLRAGEQIDPVVNVTQLPTIAGNGTLVGPARPMFTFKESSFWAQGVNLGLEFRY